MSRLNLNLVATHADQAGGFLGTAHTSFGIFAFSLSSVLSAEAAFLMVFHKAEIASFQIPYIAILVMAEIMFLGPSLVFIPILIRTRLAGLHDYSLLVARYNRAFHEKWIAGKTPPDEPFLGSPDIQSLADLGSSFEFIRAMKVVPVSLRAMLQLAVVTSLPCLPLILLVMPLNEVVGILVKAVF